MYPQPRKTKSQSPTNPKNRSNSGSLHRDIANRRSKHQWEEIIKNKKVVEVQKQTNPSVNE